jgi:polysaccharide deacetylase family protein (PEP-CTERM system associated)
LVDQHWFRNNQQRILVNQMAVCFTFDIEQHDWIEAAVGHTSSPPLQADYARRMETCTRWLLDTLAEFGARATFFVVGQIARTHPKLLRDMAAAGHEVGCHSLKHWNVHRQTPEAFRADVREATDVLQQASGSAVVGYRAPTFSVTRATAWAIDVLAEEGMRYDSSVYPVRHDRYGVPDAPRFPFVVIGRERYLLELPPATLGIAGFNLPAGGGGYFRLFPPAVMRAAVHQTRKHRPGIPVLYFHPWEFDASQPRLPLGTAGRLRTYLGISGSRARFRRLLDRYGSLRMIDAVEQLQRQQLSLPAFRLDASLG